MSRFYKSAAEDAAVIATEVLKSKESVEWSMADDRGEAVAIEIEKLLSKFNIGYVDDNRGQWKHKLGGSKFFAVKRGMKVARAKSSNLISSIKSRFQ